MTPGITEAGEGGGDVSVGCIWQCKNLNFVVNGLTIVVKTPSIY